MYYVIQMEKKQQKRTDYFFMTQYQKKFGSYGLHSSTVCNVESVMCHLTRQKFSEQAANWAVIQIGFFIGEQVLLLDVPSV